MTAYSLVVLLSQIEPAHCSMSNSNYCFFSCIQFSQEAGNVVWYSHLTKNIPQFVMIHTVKVGEGWQRQRGMTCMCSKRCGTRASQVPQWKESACQCRWCRRHGFNRWVKKIPWRRKWQVTPVFLPGKPRVLRSLVGHSPQGHKESDTTDWLSMHTVKGFRIVDEVEFKVKNVNHSVMSNSCWPHGL